MCRVWWVFCLFFLWLSWRALIMVVHPAREMTSGIAFLPCFWTVAQEKFPHSSWLEGLEVSNGYICKKHACSSFLSVSISVVCPFLQCNRCCSHLVDFFGAFKRPDGSIRVVLEYMDRGSLADVTEYRTQIQVGLVETGGIFLIFSAEYGRWGISRA